MKLRNDGESFKMIYNGNEITIPSGKFEVTNNILGNFIQFTANNWGKPVVTTEDKQSLEIKPEITPEVISEPKEETIVEPTIVTEGLEPDATEVTVVKTNATPKVTTKK